FSDFFVGKRNLNLVLILLIDVGKFQDGKEFSSSQAGYPFECKIGVGQVIKGWDEVMKLSLGEQARLTISPEDAYGSQGFGNIIGPNSTLVL
ncbi:9839_t:CDS:2, partial [Acaulospora colombiana]